MADTTIRDATVRDAQEPAVKEVAADPQAAPPTSDVDALTERIEEIEEQLKKSAEEKKKADDKKKSEGDKKSDKGEANPLDKFKEKWNVKLGGHVQMDYVNWANGSPAIVGQQDYFEFRRLRLVADGTGYGQYDFRLQ